MIGDSLRIHEELLLLCRGENGRMVGNGQHLNALAGAILAELLLNNRVQLDAATKKGRVQMVDTRLLGDPLLDEACERIRVARRPAAASTWIVRIAGFRKLLPRLTERLWLAGILRREERPFLLFFTRTFFPLAHALPRQRLLERLRAAVLSDDPVDPRTAALLAFAHGNGLLPQALPRKQLRPRKRRIKAIVEAQPVARALAEAIAASTPHHSPVPLIALLLT